MRPYACGYVCIINYVFVFLRDKSKRLNLRSPNLAHVMTFRYCDTGLDFKSRGKCDGNRLTTFRVTFGLLFCGRGSLYVPGVRYVFPHDSTKLPN